MRGKLLAGEFSTGTEVYLPFIIINGKEDGNTVWVNACVHGNELNGVLAAQKLAHESFVERLAEINMEEVDDSQHEYLCELIDFLLGWLKNHILKMDKKIPVK